MSEELLMRIQELATKRKELEQQLANATKQNVMLRDGLKRADDLLRTSYDHVSPLIREALAATANLDGLILCKKKPTAWCRDVIYEMPPEFAFSWMETQLHEFPLYRAWEPTK